MTKRTLAKGILCCIFAAPFVAIGVEMGLLMGLKAAALVAATLTVVSGLMWAVDTLTFDR